VSDRFNDRYSCAVELALEVLGGKWKPVILAHLKEGPKRYSELRQLVSKMSDKMLTHRLRDLVELGLVERQDDAGGARYRLTAEGDRLRPVLQSLHDWGLSIAREHHVRLDNDG
jgi:DNA-binding HxlR family transcriptional regulator